MTMVPAYDAPEFISTAEAREAAASIIIEVDAHRMDPVVSVVPVHESVHVTVKPDTLRVWQTWVSLFDVHDAAHRRVMSTGHGRWQGVPVVLVGLEPSTWR